MRRRAFALGLPAMAALTFAARAQPPGRVYRIGALLGGGRDAMEQYRKALSDQLASHGFVEGRNLQIDSRGATGSFHEDREVAREFVAARYDAILVCETRSTQAALSATKVKPVIFAWVADPVASGIVKEYARPGANVSGVTNRSVELFVKRMELVRELIPGARRVAVIHYPHPFYADVVAPSLCKAAAQLQFDLMEIGDLQFAAAIERAGKDGAEAILPVDNFVGNRVTGEQVVEVTARLRVPAVFANANMVEAGGLISLGTDLQDELRRAADMLARVLRGANPGSMPVDQAARFELVLNRKAAQGIGIAIPRSILLRADRVIG